MSEPKQAAFEGWAIVEIFGHQKAIGFVTTEAYGSAVLFRVDSPELPEREHALKRDSYLTVKEGEGLTKSKWFGAGSKVKREAVQASSQLIGPGAIYRLVPCTETVAREALEELIPRPLILLEEKKEATPLLPGEAQDRTFACCGGNPEDGHRGGCEEEFDEEQEQDETLADS